MDNGHKPNTKIHDTITTDSRRNKHQEAFEQHHVLNINIFLNPKSK